MREQQPKYASFGPEHAKKLVDAKDLTPETAKALLHEWKQSFPLLFETLNEWAKKEGYVISFTGRRHRPAK